MRIITNNRFKDWTIQVDCNKPNCGAVLELDTMDIYAPNGDSHDLFMWRCPVCEGKSRIPSSLLPPGLRAALEANREVYNVHR